VRRAEAAFGRQVIRRARRAGVLAHWCLDSRYCAGQRGFPDLVLAGQGGTIFRELKTGAGDTSAGQDLWGWMLRSGPLPVPAWAIWRPADLESGLIEMQLRMIGETR